MADNKVLRSIEAPGGQRCVDIFQRPDGSWGAAEYRRDPEDGSGWYPTHACPDLRCDGPEAALTAARSALAWLAET
jgi:hypothetical protein